MMCVRNSSEAPAAIRRPCGLGGRDGGRDVGCGSCSSELWEPLSVARVEFFSSCP